MILTPYILDLKPQPLIPNLYILNPNTSSLNPNPEFLNRKS